MTPPKHNHESFNCGEDCPNLAHLRAEAERQRRMKSSPAETLLAVQLEQAGIPFLREYKFHPERKWRADFVIEGMGRYHDSESIALLVEIDGGAFIAGRHSRGTGVEKDAEKQSAAAILGYRVIRLTPRQVEDGRGLLWIKQALGLEEAA